MKAPASPIWDCPVCMEQFFGGPRCGEHNPTPEERDLHELATVSRQTSDAEAYAF